MSYLPLPTTTFTSGQLVRPSRELGRDLARLDEGTTYGLARLDATERLQAAKVDALQATGDAALQAVAGTLARANQVAQLVPESREAAALVARTVVLGIAGIVSDTELRLRRLP